MGLFLGCYGGYEVCVHNHVKDDNVRSPTEDCYAEWEVLIKNITSASSSTCIYEVFYIPPLKIYFVVVRWGLGVCTAKPQPRKHQHTA